MVAQKNLALLAILNKGAAKRSRPECHFVERHVVYGHFYAVSLSSCHFVERHHFVHGILLQSMCLVILSTDKSSIDILYTGISTVVICLLSIVIFSLILLPKIVSFSHFIYCPFSTVILSTIISYSHYVCLQYFCLIISFAVILFTVISYGHFI